MSNTTLRIYQVDAFHHQVLRGNPAAVIPLAEWLPDELLQAIALENNLSETAYFLPADDNGLWALRWFTPVREVRLCGHATLATAHVLYNEILVTQPKLRFSTLSGILEVSRQGDGYLMDFPADEPEALPTPAELAAALGQEVLETFAGKDDFLCILPDEEAVRNCRPDLKAIAEMSFRGVLVSAPGSGEVDFVSRCFFPQFGIDEDPVTGSAHTLMTPYWAKRLGKDTLSARQISQREGILTCTMAGSRVLLQGQAVTYLKGEIFV